MTDRKVKHAPMALDERKRWMPINTLKPERKFKPFEQVALGKFWEDSEGEWQCSWLAIGFWHCGKLAMWTTPLDGLSGGTACFRLRGDASHWMSLPEFPNNALEE